MYYQKEMEVRIYSCDVMGRMKVSALMQRMQQTSGAQLAELGLPYEKLYREGMVFLLSKMCIKIHRIPTVGEIIRVGTVPVATKGARFIREFVVESPDGNRLVSAMSLWMLVNPETRRILRPSHFPYHLPFRASVIGEAIGDVELPRQLGEGERLRTEVAVRYSHIDCNEHVNNSVYGDFVCDALPYRELRERGLDMVVVSYQSEAKWGDTLHITTDDLGSGSYRVCGTKEGGSCFDSLVQLKGKALIKKDPRREIVKREHKNL